MIDAEATSSALDRTVSRMTQRTGRSTRSVVIDPDAEPPDGGIHAWLKVYGCFLMYANTMHVYPMDLNAWLLFADHPHEGLSRSASEHINHTTYARSCLT